MKWVLWISGEPTGDFQFLWIPLVKWTPPESYQQIQPFNLTRGRWLGEWGSGPDQSNEYRGLGQSNLPRSGLIFTKFS